MPEVPLYSEWESGGETYFVKTGRNSGEGEADWRQRHNSMVASMQIDFPPDP